LQITDEFCDTVFEVLYAVMLDEKKTKKLIVVRERQMKTLLFAVNIDRAGGAPPTYYRRCRAACCFWPRRRRSSLIGAAPGSTKNIA
jgi:hypothetical protein